MELQKERRKINEKEIKNIKKEEKMLELSN